MGQTIKRYPIVEVALLCQNNAPLASGHERAICGDIVAVRPPNTGVGMLEMHRYLWLRLSGWEEGPFGTLTTGVPGYEKRRYQIPLTRLKAIMPAFDLDKAQSAGVVYQPFLNVDEDTGVFLGQSKPLDVHGLVFDTATGRYL